jgi:hypothetical protein
LQENINGIYCLYYLLNKENKMNATSAAQKTTPNPSITRQAKEKPAAAKPAAKVAVNAAAKPVAKLAVKPAAKPAPKPAARAAVKTVAKPVNKIPAVKAAVVANGSGTAVAKPAQPAKAAAKPAATVTAEKEKPKKIKLVRDSFTMPESEYAVLGQVKKTCLKAGVEVKKSELLRIGVALIRDLDIASLKRVLATLPQLKSGRPVKEK